MSDARLTPAQLRRKSLALMRRCFLPLLLAALLTTLLSSCGDLANRYGEVAAERIEQAVFAEFEAENPRPADPAALEDWETERIVHAYFSSADLTAERIKRQWTLIGYAIDLAGIFISAIILVGLYHGLLTHMRNDAPCTPRRLLAGGLKRWKTAIALEFQITLRLLGYHLLGVIAIFLLSFIPILGALGAAIGYVVMMYWVSLRYFDAKIHLADDTDHQLTSTDCIAYSLHDAEMYSIPGLFKTLWPAFVPAILGSLLANLLPASPLVSGADLALGMLSFAMQAAICTVIYTLLQTDKPPVQDDANESPGLARARALAQEESAI